MFKDIVRFSADNDASQEGSGLGLWSKFVFEFILTLWNDILLALVSKGIIELHGGKIGVSSDGPGCGCTFIVDLPLLNFSFRGGSLRGDHRRIYASSVSPAFAPTSHSHNNRPPPIPGSSPSPSQSGKRFPLHHLIVGLDGGSRNSSLRGNGEGTAIMDRENDHQARSAVSFDEKVADEKEKERDRAPPSGWATPIVDGGAIVMSLGDGPVDPATHAPPTLRRRRHSGLGSLTSLSTDQPPPFSWGGLRVLVVDDAPLNRRMLCRLLRGRCEECHEASDGQEALNMTLATLRESGGKPYEVILMDYQMPNMDGPASSSAMRDAGYEGIIIGVTGISLQSDIQYFLNHGANRVMTKPLDLQALEAALAGSYFRL